MQYAERMGMTFFSRAAAAAGISLVLTLLLLLIFQVDAPASAPEALGTSADGAPTMSGSAIRPISLR